MSSEGLRLPSETSLDNVDIIREWWVEHNPQPVEDILKAVPLVASLVAPALLGDCLPLHHE